MEITNKKNIGHFEISPQLKISKNYLAEIVLFLVLTGLLYWLVVKPKAADLGLKKDQLAQLEKDQEGLGQSINTMQLLIRDMKSQTQEVDKLDEALPLQSSTLRLNLLVKTLANSAGVIVRDVNFVSSGNALAAGNMALLAQPFAVTRSLKSTQGSVTVTGSYNNLQAFLKKVEGNSRIMDIQDMEISGIDKDTLNLKLDLLTYSYE
jgi:Tfp pilus assembly protein PilO